MKKGNGMFKSILVVMGIVVFAFADGPALKTAQTESYNEYGNTISDGSVKDDGFYQAGISREWTYNEVTNIITAHSTGLQWFGSTIEKEWLTDENFNSGNYNDTSGDTATTYCDGLIVDGLNDWRLPSINELITLDSNISGYVNLFGYWSSSTDVSDSSKVWILDTDGGYMVNNRSKSYDTGSNVIYEMKVACVRDEFPVSSTLSRSNEIVTDHTTGLQWQDDANTKTVVRDWIGSIDYCEELTLGGFLDWRLPNKNELYSIVDYNSFDPAIDTSVFVNGFSNAFWSSTTDEHDHINAYGVGYIYGTSGTVHKSNTFSVRCVRSGEYTDPDGINPILSQIDLPYKEAVKPETFNLYIEEITDFNPANLSATINGSPVSIVETNTAGGAVSITFTFEGDITNTGEHTVAINYDDKQATITVNTVKNTVGEPFRLAKQSGGFSVSRGIASDHKFEIKALDRSIVSLDPGDASPFKKRIAGEASLSNRTPLELHAYTDQSAGLLVGASTGLEVDIDADLGLGFSFPGFPLDATVFKTEFDLNGFGYVNTYAGRFYYPSDQNAIAFSTIPALLATIAPVGLFNVVADQNGYVDPYKKNVHYGYDFQAAFSNYNLEVKPSFLGLQSDIFSVSFSLVNPNGRIRAEWFKGEEGGKNTSLVRMQTETIMSAMAGSFSVFQNDSIFGIDTGNADEFEFGVDRDNNVFRSTFELVNPAYFENYPISTPFVKRMDEYQLSNTAFAEMESQFGVFLDNNYEFTEPVLVKTWLRSDDVVKDYALQAQVDKHTFGLSFQNSSFEDALAGVSYVIGDESYIIYANKVLDTPPSTIGETSSYKDYPTNVIKTALSARTAELGSYLKEKLVGAIKAVTETVEEGWKVARDGGTTVYKAWRDAPSNIRFLWNTFTDNNQLNGIYADLEPQQAALNNANLVFHSDILDINLSEGEAGGEVILYATYDPLNPETGVYKYNFDEGQWVHIESVSNDGGLRFMVTQGGYYALIDAFSKTEDVFSSDVYAVERSVTKEIVSEPVYMSDGTLAANQEFNLTLTGSYAMVDGELQMGVQIFSLPATVTSNEEGIVTIDLEAGSNIGRATVVLSSFRGYTQDSFDVVVTDETMGEPIEDFTMAINVPSSVTLGEMIVVEANITQVHSDVNFTITAPNGASSYTSSVEATMKGAWSVFLSAKDENGYEHTTSRLITVKLPTTSDFTFNGYNDVLWHQASTGAVKIMKMEGLNTVEEVTVVGSSNLNLIPKGIGDFNGDSKPDILVHNQNTGMARAWLMDGTTRISGTALLDSSNTNLQIAGVGDFDGDGDSDIAAFNTNSGTLRIWVMEGTVRVGNITVLSGANPNLVPRGAGDMDNDGIPDLVLRNNNSGAVRVWTMNNDFTRKGNEYVTGSSNTNLELRGVVDIDGDGNADILNYNTNTGRLRAWLMDGGMGILENAEVVQDTDLDWSVRN